MNTREGRKRELLDLERREAIGECMKLNSAYKPPSGFKPVTKEAKLYIPAKEHPGYNFIGLILGPRGNTQKRMESETGAKITIRGKGAVKEGKMQTGRNGKDVDGAFEELHVHISADSFEKVDAAVAIIEPLLTPVDEDRNMHKMKQLRELAEMNGTLNDFTRVCSVCGEAGHREWQCSKDKLQNFQANVTCQICGDGGHPTIDCPLKSSGQGMTFDKEYLNFLEEVGTGLQSVGTSTKGDHPSEANISQPMLLTTSGAQPVPPRWIAPAIGTEPLGSSASRGPPDGASLVGVVPRFPNPAGFQGMFPNPPGSPGLFPTPPGFPNPPGFQGMNSFLPRFSQSGAMPSGFLRGQPFPGPAFPHRGQVSAPPAGLASDMRPPGPPIVPTGMPPPPSTPGQTQASVSANEGTIRGSQSVSSTQVENERKYILNAMSVVSSMAAAPSLSSSMTPFPGAALPGASNIPPAFVSSTVHPLPSFSPVATLAQPVPPTSTSNPASARPVLPLAPLHMVVPPPVIHPMRPVLPSIRPVPPSVGPMGSIAAQGPSLAGGPGQGFSNGIPSFGGIINDALPSGNSSFARPPQPLPGGPTGRGQGQYPGPPPSPQQLASTLPLPRPFPPLSSPPLPTPIRVSVPDPMQGQTITRTSPGLFPSSMSPSFSPILPRTPQSQSVVNPNNQSAAQPFSHSSPRPMFPPLLGAQIRPINPLNTMPSIGGNSLLASSSHHTGASQQNILRQPQELPRPSILLNTQLSQQGNAFPRAEFHDLRHPGAQLRAEFRNPGLHQPGILVSPSSILGSPGFNMNRPPAQMPPQEALNRGLSSNFSRPAAPTNPMPILAGSTGAVNASWDGSLPYMRPRQLQGQSGMVVNKSWNADPHLRPQLLNVPMRQTAEVDPEYEKLMASVGVL